MERIYLSKEEKATLRHISLGWTFLPKGMQQASYIEAIIALTDKALIVSNVNYGKVVSARLTNKGKAYMASNPHLHNPIRWEVITAIATTITAVVAILALFIACSQFEYGTH